LVGTAALSVYITLWSPALSSRISEPLFFFCRSSLAALFAERGQAVMLVEAAVRLGTMPHAVVDVVPSDRHIAMLDVKAGFKQVLSNFMSCIICCCSTQMQYRHAVVKYHVSIKRLFLNSFNFNLRHETETCSPCESELLFFPLKLNI